MATLAALILLCTRLPAFRNWVPKRWRRRPGWCGVRHLLAIGVPTSVQLVVEVSAFVLATIVIGTLGAQALAAHQGAISCASMVFTMPLGIAMALTVRVGEAVGAGCRHRIRPTVLSGWLLAAGFTVFSALAFLTLNRSIASLFLAEPDAVTLTASLLAVAAAFQLGDALQVVSAGALRGLNDVRVPAWIAVFAYWVVSLPLGWWLAVPRAWGVAGMWWGITAGLSLTAAFLGWRIWRMSATGKPRAIPWHLGPAAARAAGAHPAATAPLEIPNP